MAIQKIIEYVAQTVGFDKAKVQIEETEKATKDLDKAQKDYGTTVDKVNGKVQGLLSNFNLFGINLGNLYGNLVKNISGFKGLSTTLTGTIKGFKLSTLATKQFAVALISTGIGAIVVGLGTLVAVLASTQKGMDAFSRVIEPIKAQLQTLFGVIQDVALAFGSIMSGNFKEGFKALGDSVSDLGSKMVEAGERGDRLAQIKKELNQAAIELARTEGKANDELERAKGIIDDQTASEEERKKAIEDANKAINDKYDAQEKLKRLELEEMAIKQSNNDTSDEEKLAYEQLKAELDKLSSSRQKEINLINKKEQTINKQIETQKKAELKAWQDKQKEIEAQRKQEIADEEAFNEKRKEIQRGFQDFETSLIKDKNDRAIAEAENRLARVTEDTNKEYAVLFEKYAEDKEKLAQLEAEKNTILENALIQKQNIVTKAEEDKRKKEEADKEAKLKAKEEADKAELALIAEKEARRKEILGLDEEEELSPADKLRQEKKEELKALEEWYGEDLEKLKDYLKRKEELNAQYDEKIKQTELQLNREVIQGKLSQAQQYTSAVNNLTNDIFAFAENIGKQDEKSKEKRAKRQFAVNKAFEIGQATIGGAKAIISALGAPFPLNLVQVPIAAATTAASIAKIASTKFDGGGGGGVETPDLDNGGGNDDETTIPDVSMFDGLEDAEDQSTTDLGQPRNQTIRAVVVESDITDTTDRLNNIESGSEL